MKCWHISALFLCAITEWVEKKKVAKIIDLKSPAFTYSATAVKKIIRPWSIYLTQSQ